MRRLAAASSEATIVVRNCSDGGEGDRRTRVEEGVERASGRRGGEEFVARECVLIWNEAARQEC